MYLIKVGVFFINTPGPSQGRGRWQWRAFARCLSFSLRRHKGGTGAVFVISLHRVLLQGVVFLTSRCALSPKGPGGSQLQVEAYSVSLQAPAGRYHARTWDGAVGSTHRRRATPVTSYDRSHTPNERAPEGVRLRKQQSRRTTRNVRTPLAGRPTAKLAGDPSKARRATNPKTGQAPNYFLTPTSAITCLRSVRQAALLRAGGQFAESPFCLPQASQSVLPRGSFLSCVSRSRALRRLVRFLRPGDEFRWEWSRVAPSPSRGSSCGGTRRLSFTRTSRTRRRRQSDPGPTAWIHCLDSQWR